MVSIRGNEESTAIEASLAINTGPVIQDQLYNGRPNDVEQRVVP